MVQHIAYRQARLLQLAKQQRRPRRAQRLLRLPQDLVFLLSQQLAHRGTDAHPAQLVRLRGACDAVGVRDQMPGPGSSQACCVAVPGSSGAATRREQHRQPHLPAAACSVHVEGRMALDRDEAAGALLSAARARALSLHKVPLLLCQGMGARNRGVSAATGAAVSVLTHVSNLAGRNDPGLPRFDPRLLRDGPRRPRGRRGTGELQLPACACLRPAALAAAVEHQERAFKVFGARKWPG